MNAVRKIEDGTQAAAPERPTDIAVSMIHRGRIGRGTVNTRLPYDIGEKTRFYPAPRMSCADETLEAIKGVADRCVPWVKVLVGPRVCSYNQPGEDLSAFRRAGVSPDGRPIHEIAGQAFSRPHVPDGSPEVILATNWTSATGALSTLHHEIWHVVEYHVAAGDFGAVDAVAGAGCPLPGDYLGSNFERRARLYENWACACDEGWRPVSLFGIPVSRIDRVFLAIYRGDMAADIAAGRPAPERLFPGEKTVRAMVAAVRQIWGELGWQGIMLAGVAGLTLARWL